MSMLFFYVKISILDLAATPSHGTALNKRYEISAKTLYHKQYE